MAESILKKCTLKNKRKKTKQGFTQPEHIVEDEFPLSNTIPKPSERIKRRFSIITHYARLTKLESINESKIGGTPLKNIPSLFSIEWNNMSVVTPVTLYLLLKNKIPRVNFTNSARKSLYILCEILTEISSSKMRGFNVLQSEEKKE